MSGDPSLLSKLFGGAAHATGDARDRIVSSAVEQISDFGVRRFTVDELARRVGLSRVTIYRHFPSKDEVLEAAVLHELQKLMSEVEAAVAPYSTVEERVVECFVYTVSYLRAHSAFQRLLRTEPELILPLLTTRGGPVLEICREFISTIGRDVDTPPDSRQLAILSELQARLTISIVLTPESVAPLQTEAELRRYAERFIGGIVRAFAVAPDPA